MNGTAPRVRGHNNNLYGSGPFCYKAVAETDGVANACGVKGIGAMISRDTVLKIARLARLELSPEEIDRMGSQLGRILQYVEMIQAVDTAGVEPTAHVLDVTMTLRPDTPAEAEVPPGAFLKSAPDSGYGFFKVPRIVEGGEHGSV
jgi:aspartyl-tRNA(Asn)/glutamyl-tRNA(Gln) amidotransferase subunit C